MAYHPLLEQQIKELEQQAKLLNLQANQSEPLSNHSKQEADQPTVSHSASAGHYLSLNKELLAAISATYATLAHNDEHQQTQERIKRQNTALISLSHALDEDQPLEEAFKDISYSCAQTLGACRTGIWLFNDNETQLECDSEYDTHSNTYFNRKTLHTEIHPEYFAELATKRVMATRDAIHHKGNTTLSREYLQQNSVKAMLDTPIKADGFYLGVLRVYQMNNTRYWHQDEQQYAASIADMIALAYQKYRRQAALAALNESENRFKALAQSTGAAIFAFRESIIYANQAAEKLIQLDEESLKILPVSVVFGSAFSAQFNNNTLRKNITSKGIEIEFSRSSGEIRWAFINVTQANYAGEQTWLASAFDITERKRAEVQMRYQAFHDNLTGLPNRTLLIESIDSCLNKASRDRYYRFAACQITLQNVKDLNQQIGHSVGDHYIIDFALRLKKACQLTDTLAKISQDTFIIIRENLKSKEQFIEQCQMLHAQLNQEVILEENTLCLPITMGLVYCDHYYHAAEDVIRHAFIATEHATQAPEKNIHTNICVFNAIMHQSFKQQKELATRLRKAFKNQEFSIRYWRIHALHATSNQHSNTVMIEPLIQWREGNAYRLNQGHFLLTQKDMHFMRSLSYWLIKNTLQQCMRQNNEAPITIWLDITHDGFNEPQEFEKLILTIGEQQLTHCNVVLQIPLLLAQYYSAANANKSQYKKLHSLLQKNNCQIGLDISQCKLAHLNILQNLPLSYVKIPPQAAHGLQPQSPAIQLLQALIHYYQSLGLNLLIQELDDQDTLNTISQLTAKMAAAYGQGYCLSSPIMPCDLLSKTLKTG